MLCQAELQLSLRNYSMRTAALSRGSLFVMFGNLLKKARLNAGMTQEALAKKALLTREYISLLEMDKRTPTITVFIRLMRAVDHSPAEVIQQLEKALPKKASRY